MRKSFSRRQFGTGIAGLATGAIAGSLTHAWARAAEKPGTPCDDAIPSWATALQADLRRMAHDLTARLKPWSGPRLVVRPEDFAFRPREIATRAIQSAIDSVAERGGGTVLLANGDYVSGTLDLRSNVRLEIARGARLLASLDLKDYPERVAKRRTVMDTNMGMNQSLIFAEGCRNISLSGAGTIEGRGTKENFAGSETVGATPGRPFLIRVIDCQNVHITGLRMKDAACWMQNYLNCEDLLIEHLHVENQANFNNDGLDIDGCRRVIVRHCLINAEDDALCFKGASQRPMENVLVENCRLYSSCNGIKFGTDSQGDFRRVIVRDLEVGGTPDDMRSLNRRRADSGISWEVVDGGTVEDIVATRIRVVRAKSPLFLRLGDRGRVRPEDPRPPPGHLRRIVFDRITGQDTGPRGSYFIGLPDKPIEDVVMHDVHLPVTAASGAAPDQTTIPQMRTDYPDAHMIDGVAPAYGLWARHVSGLTLHRVSFKPESADARPEILATLETSGVCRA